MKYLGDALRTNQVSRQLLPFFFCFLHSHLSQTLTTLDVSDDRIGDEGAKYLEAVSTYNRVSFWCIGRKCERLFPCR